MRKNIEFRTEDGITLRGWHYVPDTGKGPFPTIVMAHGFSATKELFLDKYADLYCASGMAVLVYDHRNLGASDGEPRQEIDPWAQINGYRDAITFVETLPETDASKIGIFGSSYSGGHVLVVGALDRRVKCVVSQVPLVDGPRNAQRLVPAHAMADMRAMMDFQQKLLKMSKDDMIAALDQIASLGYMHPGRVDVITSGALILSRIMAATGASEFVASESDILDGIAWSLSN